EGSEHALLIRETDAPALIGNRRMIFSRAPHTRQAYQYATWTEPAAARFTTLLTDRLAAGGMFTAISTTSGHRGTGIPADLQLAVELREFYHDGAVPPGTARLEIDARLLDAAAGRLVAHRRFRTAAPVSTYDAAGAAAALSDAVGTALDELTAWLAGTIDTLPR
ncbi:MAG: membrane integrity-associated transporter subunit PqiC, partial [Deltaproteobacteria bacterium]|nr:membrane integrity-associated transporter subunit PqiC [Candidatus Anaeroferrophillacea bacterium]